MKATIRTTAATLRNKRGGSDWPKQLAKVASIAVLAVTLLGLTPVLQASAASGAWPTCSSPSVDPDGDGYGWENNQTCLVDNNQTNNNSSQAASSGSTTNGWPTCSSASVDPDGDGYGWENNQTCLVDDNQTSNNSSQAGNNAVDTAVDTATNTARNSDGWPTCSSASVDPDGDGYGWENNQTCAVDDSQTTDNADSSGELLHIPLDLSVFNGDSTLRWNSPIGGTATVYQVWVDQDGTTEVATFATNQRSLTVSGYYSNVVFAVAVETGGATAVSNIIDYRNQCVVMCSTSDWAKVDTLDPGVRVTKNTRTITEVIVAIAGALGVVVLEGIPEAGTVPPSPEPPDPFDEDNPMVPDELSVLEEWAKLHLENHDEINEQSRRRYEALVALSVDSEEYSDGLVTVFTRSGFDVTDSYTEPDGTQVTKLQDDDFQFATITVNPDGSVTETYVNSETTVERTAHFESSFFGLVTNVSDVETTVTTRHLNRVERVTYRNGEKVSSSCSAYEGSGNACSPGADPVDKPSQPPFSFPDLTTPTTQPDNYVTTVTTPQPTNYVTTTRGGSDDPPPPPPPKPTPSIQRCLNGGGC